MVRLLQYYARYQNARGVVGVLPGWAKFFLLIVAIPGILCLALSLLAVCVSIVALLLLTVPAYRLLNAVAGRRSNESNVHRRDEMSAAADFVEVRDDGFTVDPSPMPTVVVENPSTTEPQRPRRQIDVKIVE